MLKLLLSIRSEGVKIEVPLPYAANLKKLALPQVSHIIDAVKSVCYRS